MSKTAQRSSRVNRTSVLSVNLHPRLTIWNSCLVSDQKSPTDHPKFVLGSYLLSHTDNPKTVLVSYGYPLSPTAIRDQPTTTRRLFVVSIQQLHELRTIIKQELGFGIEHDIITLKKKCIIADMMRFRRSVKWVFLLCLQWNRWMLCRTPCSDIVDFIIFTVEQAVLKLRRTVITFQTKHFVS